MTRRRLLRAKPAADSGLFGDELGTLEVDRQAVHGDTPLIRRATPGRIAPAVVDAPEPASPHAAVCRWHETTINKSDRRKLNGHASGVIWLTGLSGAGKSTLANALEKRLWSRGVRSYLLDGDNVRHGLNSDLGFTQEDRAENIRRVAEVSKLMVDAGLVVITAFISPFRAERQLARSLFADGEFVEVFVDTPLVVAEQRDPKGLYRRARRGELKHFTGIDSPYEIPQNPEIVIDTTSMSVHESADCLDQLLTTMGFLGPVSSARSDRARSESS
jgi:bifunctional enzyme CysN/CysC